MATGVLGTASTIVWSGATGLLTNYLDAEHSGYAPTVIPSSNMATVGGKTFAHGSQYDPGTLSVTIRWDGSVAIPALGATGSMLMTDSAGEKIQFENAILQDQGFSIPMEDYIQRTLTFKLSGNVTYPT